MPGVRAVRAEAGGCFADGAKLALGAAAFFGTTPSVTEARGRAAAADLVDVAESGETTDERDGAAGAGLAVEGEDVAEDNLPDVEADNVDDRAGGAVDFPGSIDVLRVGAGTEEGVVVDDLGGIVALEAGPKVDEGDFLAEELDVTTGFGVEEAWAVVVDLPVTAGVSAVLEVGGGTTLVRPVPNLPELNICNA